MFCNLWNDNRGGVITSELVLVASVTVGILLSGLASLRAGLVDEYEAVEQAIRSQSVATSVPLDEPQQAPRQMGYLEVFDPQLEDD